MDGVTIAASDEMDVTLAFSGLMAAYFVYGVQYPRKLRNTSIFMERCVFRITSAVFYRQSTIYRTACGEYVVCMNLAVDIDPHQSAVILTGVAMYPTTCTVDCLVTHLLHVPVY